MDRVRVEWLGTCPEQIMPLYDVTALLGEGGWARSGRPPTRSWAARSR